jgi:hypothetical protein
MSTLYVPELYKTLDFKHTSIESKVVLWMHPTNLDIGSPIPKESVITLDIKWTLIDPADLYKSPSSSHIIFKDGLGIYTDSFRSYLPLGTRHCYQCEYDEYIYTQSKLPNYIEDKRDEINILVWDAVQKYLHN